MKSWNYRYRVSRVNIATSVKPVAAYAIEWWCQISDAQLSIRACSRQCHMGMQRVPNSDATSIWEGRYVHEKENTMKPEPEYEIWKNDLKRHIQIPNKPDIFVIFLYQKASDITSYLTLFH